MGESWTVDERGRLSAFGESFYRYASEQEAVAPAVARAIAEVLAPASVVDVGCGLALYLAELAELGVEVRGYEGSPYALGHSRAEDGVVLAHDLTEPLETDEVFDLCVCSEVAEHMSERFAPTLIDTLTRLSDAVYFTAAGPSQSGQGHVNVKPPEWWAELFAERGFRLDGALTDGVKAALRREAPHVGPGHRVWSNCLIYVRVTDGQTMG